MVSVQMLVIVVRFLQIGLKVRLEGQRAGLVSSERIETERYVCIDVKVIDLMAKEVVFSCGIPFQIFVILALRSSIQVYRVLVDICRTCQIIQRPE